MKKGVLSCQIYDTIIFIHPSTCLFEQFQIFCPAWWRSSFLNSVALRMERRQPRELKQPKQAWQRMQNVFGSLVQFQPDLRVDP